MVVETLHYHNTRGTGIGSSGIPKASGAGSRAGMQATPGVSSSRQKCVIRVMLVDRHPVVRLGIAMSLADAAHLQIVAEAGDAREALGKAVAHSPHVVLMDTNLPDFDGLVLTKCLREAMPGVRVLIFSGTPPTDAGARALRSGARGFIAKRSTTQELIGAIEAVHAGGTYFSAGVAPAVLLRLARPSQNEAAGRLLSPREREVLTQIAEGLGNKQIASLFRLHLRTVETHRERLMRKLRIHSIAGLTRFAVANGYVRLEGGQYAAAE